MAADADDVPGQHNVSSAAASGTMRVSHGASMSRGVPILAIYQRRAMRRDVLSLPCIMAVPKIPFLRLSRLAFFPSPNFQRKEAMQKVFAPSLLKDDGYLFYGANFEPEACVGQNDHEYTPK